VAGDGHRTKWGRGGEGRRMRKESRRHRKRRRGRSRDVTEDRLDVRQGERPWNNLVSVNEIAPILVPFISLRRKCTSFVSDCKGNKKIGPSNLCEGLDRNEACLVSLRSPSLFHLAGSGSLLPVLIDE
jgi:hypothetical protein